MGRGVHELKLKRKGIQRLFLGILYSYVGIKVRTPCVCNLLAVDIIAETSQYKLDYVYMKCTVRQSEIHVSAT